MFSVGKIGKINKRQIFLVRTMKACRGNGSIAPFILKLGTKWRWMVNFTLRLLYPWGKTLVLIGCLAGRALKPVWTFSDFKNFLLLLGFEPRIIQQVV